MEKVYELRLTKTQYERLFRYALIGNFVETFDQEELKEREFQLMLMLMAVAEKYGLDIVTDEADGLQPAEKVIVKMEKALARYDRFVLEKAAAKSSKK